MNRGFAPAAVPRPIRRSSGDDPVDTACGRHRLRRRVLFPVTDLGRPGIGIENRSSETVDIAYLDPAGDEHIVVADLQALSGTALLSPGRWIGDCNEGTLRAYASSGRVIAETSEGLCDGDRWVIPADASTASPG